MSKEFLNESVKQELLGKIVAFIDVFEGFKDNYVSVKNFTDLFNFTCFFKDIAFNPF